MVSDPLNASILSFCSDGVGFTIHDEHLLSSLLLPRYFNHHKLSSFIRQLNLYGIYKPGQIHHNHSGDHGPGDSHTPTPSHVHHRSNTYIHEYFRIGKKDILQFIKRKDKQVTQQQILTTVSVEESAPAILSSSLSTTHAVSMLLRQVEQMEHKYDHLM